jgi:limonene-1,2-epoxide hydrolase
VINQPADTSLSVVNAFIAAVERLDIDAAMSFLSPDCVYDNVPMKPLVGHDTIRAVLGSFMAPCTEIAWPVHRSAEAGPIVFNERTDRFLMPHGWVELGVTGVWEVHDGKITLWRDYFDLATYTNQMPGKK